MKNKTNLNFWLQKHKKIDDNAMGVWEFVVPKIYEITWGLAWWARVRFAMGSPKNENKYILKLAKTMKCFIKFWKNDWKLCDFGGYEQKN